MDFDNVITKIDLPNDTAYTTVQNIWLAIQEISLRLRLHQVDLSGSPALPPSTKVDICLRQSDNKVVAVKNDGSIVDLENSPAISDNGTKVKENNVLVSTSARPINIPTGSPLDFTEDAFNDHFNLLFVDNGITNNLIAAHTSTKITITAKGQLNSAIMYEDEDNSLGTHFLEFGEIASPANPAANLHRFYVDSTDDHFKRKDSAGVIKDYDAAASAVDTLPEDINFTGDISPAQITANQNDYNPSGLATASTLRLNTDASRNITGLAGGSYGRVIIIINVGSTDIVLTNEDAASTAANRFTLGANLTLTANKVAVLIYDSTSSRWRLVSTSVDQTGGGGGGISLISNSNTLTDIVNTTTETDIFNYTVPANTLGTTKKIKVEILFDWLNNSGASRDFTFKAYFGGTVLFQHSSNPAASSATITTGKIILELWNSGATNANRIRGHMMHSDTSTPTTGQVGSLTTDEQNADNNFASVNGTSDTTLNQVFKATVTHPVANASLSFRVQNVTITLIG